MMDNSHKKMMMTAIMLVVSYLCLLGQETSSEIDSGVSPAALASVAFAGFLPAHVSGAMRGARFCWVSGERLPVGWWQRDVPRYTNARFKRFFRMDRVAFEKLCDLVGPHLEARYNLEHWRAGSVQLRIAITLFRLARGGRIYHLEF